MRLLAINISDIKDVKATPRKKENDKANVSGDGNLKGKEEDFNRENDNNNEEEDCGSSDKPYVIYNQQDNKYDVVLGKKLISEAKADKKATIECYVLEIQEIDLKKVQLNIDINFFAEMFKEFVKQSKKWDSTTRFQPLIVYEQDSQIFLAAGYRRYELAKHFGFITVPCLVLPLSLQQAQNLTKLDFIHDFGEFGILRHPAVESKYRSLKCTLIERTVYHASLQNQNLWGKQIGVWVNESLLNLIEEYLLVLNEPGLNQQLREKIIKDGDFIQIVNKITDKLQVETFLIEDFTDFGPLIVETFKRILSKLKKMTSEFKIDRLRTAPSDYSSILIEFEKPELNDQIFQKAWFLSDSDKSSALRSLLEQQGLLYTRKSGDNPKGSIKSAIDGSNIDESIKLKIRNERDKNPSIVIDELVKNPDILEAVCQYLHKQLFANLDKLLCSQVGIYLAAEREKGSVLTSEEINKLIGKSNIGEKLLRQFVAKYDNLSKEITNFFNKVCVEYLLWLAQPHNLTKKLIVDQLATLENANAPNIVSNICASFREAMLQRRQKVLPQFHYLDDNFSKFSGNSTIDILAMLQVSEYSNRKYFKEKALEKNIFFKPNPKFATIRSYFDEYKGIIDDSDGITTLIRTYHIVNFGAITHEIKLSSTALATIHVKQLGSYSDELEKLQKVVNTGRSESEKLADVQIASWMLDFIQCKIPKDLSAEKNEIRKKVIISYFKTLIFCLFFTEIMRNPAAAITHALMLMNIIDTKPDSPIKESLKYAFTEGGFTMAPVKSTAQARITHSKLVPKFDFFAPLASNSYELRKYAIKTLSNTATDLEQRELKSFESSHETIEQLIEKIKNFYTLK